MYLINSKEADKKTNVDEENYEKSHSFHTVVKNSSAIFSIKFLGTRVGYQVAGRSMKLHQTSSKEMAACLLCIQEMHSIPDSWRRCLLKVSSSFYLLRFINGLR